MSYFTVSLSLLVILIVVLVIENLFPVGVAEQTA